MSEYRDFVGVITEDDARAYEGRANVDTIRYTQVYLATHKGEKYLPFMNRSFISFSFGGKNIESFNLIATILNNRLNRTGSAEFEDLVDSYNILDGQFYWGTHFKANKINFKLATDGMTLKELDTFKYWFLGGKTRELILAEHPNRAILARVATPPEITLLPFEEDTEVLIGGMSYKTKTTLYKGEISLSFVMDNPFWYSKINIFGYCDSDNIYHDEWTDANGLTVNVYNNYENIDVIKIVLEDNIPISGMIDASMLLGNNVFANHQSETGGRIAKNTIYILFIKGDENSALVLIGEIDFTEPGDLTVYELDDLLYEINNLEHLEIIINTINKINSSLEASTENTIIELALKINSMLTTLGEDSLEDILEDTDPRTLVGGEGSYNCATIDGPYMAADTGIINFEVSTPLFFYYAGTAPSYPEISFKLTPIIAALDIYTTNEDYYISSPANSYARGSLVNPYNTITITSLNKREFRFTTPNIYTSYNEAVKIFISLATTYNGHSWEEVRELIRDNVRHHAVRAWVNHIINLETDTIVNGAKTESYLHDLSLLFRSTNSDDNPALLESSYTFNGETGKATGIFTYRTPSTSLESIILLEVQEDVSDMVKSNYLVITDRNHPNADGYIVERIDNSTEFESTYSHKIEHDVPNGLLNLYLKYKNMYF